MLDEKDLLGRGAFAEVYRYKIKGIEIAVKCFKD